MEPTTTARSLPAIARAVQGPDRNTLAGLGQQAWRPAVGRALHARGSSTARRGLPAALWTDAYSALMPPKGHRRLATVLFVDVVDSTQVAAESGDRQWRELVGDFRAIVRRQLKRYGGREVDTAGDGFFAWFDRPASAIQAAAAIVTGVQQRGLDVRTHDELTQRARHQDLRRLGGGHHARADVSRYPAKATADFLELTRVQPAPDVQSSLLHTGQDLCRSL